MPISLCDLIKHKTELNTIIIIELYSSHYKFRYLHIPFHELEIIALVMTDKGLTNIVYEFSQKDKHKRTVNIDTLYEVNWARHNHTD